MSRNRPPGPLPEPNPPEDQPLAGQEPDLAYAEDLEPGAVDPAAPASPPMPGEPSTPPGLPPTPPPLPSSPEKPQGLSPEAPTGKRRAAVVTPKPLTGQYPLGTELAPYGVGDYRLLQIVNENVPIFWPYMVREMMRHPAIRLGMGVLRGVMMEAQYEVQCEDEAQKTFIERQLDTYRSVCLFHVLRKMEYGWLPLEVMYRYGENGSIELDRMEYRHPRWVRPVVHEQRIVGAYFQRVRQEQQDDIYLPVPKVYWAVHRSQTSFLWGDSQLNGPHVPFIEYMSPDGYFDSRRIYMRKSVIPPVIIYHPEGTTTIPLDNRGNTQTISNKDVAAAAARLIMNNAVVTIPRTKDAVDLWGVERAGDVGDPEKLFSVGKQLEEDMWMAMEIPPEVMRTDGTGSYTGREIPMLHLLSLCHGYLTEDTCQLKTQVMDHLVKWNFGKNCYPYTIQVRPLREFMTQGLGDENPEGGAANEGSANPTIPSVPAAPSPSLDEPVTDASPGESDEAAV